MRRRVFRHSPTAISDYRNIFVVVNFNLPQPTVQDLTAGIEKEILNSDNSRELSRLTFQDDMEKILILFLL